MEALSIELVMRVELARGCDLDLDKSTNYLSYTSKKKSCSNYIAQIRVTY